MNKYNHNEIQNLNFTRINEIYFKINQNNNNQNNDNQNLELLDIDILLDLIQKEDWQSFFISLGIFIQSYNLVFLVNNSDDYFVKFQILAPSLQTLLNNKNHQCIFPDCNEIILNYKTNFCPEHLESQDINNVQLMAQYFDEHSKQLKDIYKNYKEQYNLYNFLLNKLKKPNKNTLCINITIGNNTKFQFELINDTSQLLEIELTNRLNELDCLILNDTYTEPEKPYDFPIDIEDFTKIELDLMDDEEEDTEDTENTEEKEEKKEEEETEEKDDTEIDDDDKDIFDLLDNDSDSDISDTELDKADLFNLFKDLKLLNNKVI
jgi:hypothetical protein